MPLACPQLVCIAALAALLVAAPQVFAQSHASVSVGVACSVTTPVHGDAGTDAGPTLALRLRGDEGIGPAFALNWFTTPVTTDVAGQPIELGRVSVRPLLFGVTYSHHLSRLVKWNASVGGGIAFVHARGTGRLKDAFDRLGIGGVGVKGSDTFAWRASTGVWIDLSGSLGMNLSIGYLGVSPTVTMTSSAGDRRLRLDLGSVVTSIGFTYGIF